MASERTALAWERTAVASLTVAVLMVRAGIVWDLLAVAVPSAALVIAAAGAQWLFSRRIYEQHDRPYSLGAVLHEGEIAALAAVTVMAAAGSTCLVLSG